MSQTDIYSLSNNFVVIFYILNSGNFEAIELKHVKVHQSTRNKIFKWISIVLCISKELSNERKVGVPIFCY